MFRYEDGPDAASRVLIVEDELDAGAAGALRGHVDAALAARKRELVVDLSAATYVDTTVIAALIDASARLRRSGARLSIVLPPESRARVVFELTHADRVLHLVATR